MSEKTPLLRIGVLADPQYADMAPNLVHGRYYANSLEKLRQAIDHFNTENLSFVVTLGDLIDRDWRNFDAVLGVYDGLRHESVLMPGNHDFMVAPQYLSKVHERLGMPAPYHSFVRGNVRFVVIDGSEISLFSSPEGSSRHIIATERLAALKAEGAINAMEWNAGISDSQFAWISATLDRATVAGETVVVMGHYPLCPDHDHNLWGYQKLVDLFAAHDNVVAYFSGHDHNGNLGRHGNTWFVNFKGIVDTPTDTAFSVVEIFADRIEINGFGREESRVLRLDGQFVTVPVVRASA